MKYVINMNILYCWYKISKCYNLLDSCNTYKLMVFDFYWGWLLMIKGIVYILIVFIYVTDSYSIKKSTISQIIEKFSSPWYIY